MAAVARTEQQMLAWLTENVRVNEGGCRIWAGTYVGHGTKCNPAVSWLGKRRLARRLLWTLSGRELRKGQVVYLECATRGCMNLEHCRVGRPGSVSKTNATAGKCLSGMRRSIANFRAAGNTARIPYTEHENVMRLVAQGMSQREIAKRYGVSRARVGKAIQAWGRMTGLQSAA